MTTHKRGKRGISLLVAYVLLVVIAVTMSSIIYTYLKAKIPADIPTCSEDVNIYVYDPACNYTTQAVGVNALVNVSFTLQNRGLFNVSALALRISKQGSIVGSDLNPDNATIIPSLAPDHSVNVFYNSTARANIFSSASGYLDPAPATLTVQAGIYDEKSRQVTWCEEAIVRVPVECDKI
ncbi:hypothetical protein D6817_02165 [Candidatus Pacearchaeota archaeon]|nr:MAG: hypothetical protein D6817_02165 [Candidatus Pacearchaeota archaeon]